MSTTRIISNKTNDTDLFSGIYNSDYCYTLGDDYDSAGSVEARPSQRIYYDENTNATKKFIAKKTDPTVALSSRYVSKIPRHGEDTASYIYNPPHLIFGTDTDSKFKIKGPSDATSFSFVESTTSSFSFIKYKSLRNFEAFHDRVDPRVVSYAENYLNDNKSSFVTNTTTINHSSSDLKNYNTYLYTPKNSLYTYLGGKTLIMEFIDTNSYKTRVVFTDLRILAEGNTITAIDFENITDFNFSADYGTKFISENQAFIDGTTGTTTTNTLSGFLVGSSLDDTAATSDIPLTDINGNLRSFNFASLSSALVNVSNITLSMTSNGSFSQASTKFPICISNGTNTLPGYFWGNPGNGNLYFVLRKYVSGIYSNETLVFESTVNEVMFNPYNSNGVTFVGTPYNTNSGNNQIGFIDTTTGAFSAGPIIYSSLGGATYSATFGGNNFNFTSSVPGVLQTDKNVFIPGALDLPSSNAGDFVACTFDSLGNADFLVGGFSSYVKNMETNLFVPIKLMNGLVSLPDLGANLYEQGAYDPTLPSSKFIPGTYSGPTDDTFTPGNTSITSINGYSATSIFEVNSVTPTFSWNSVSSGIITGGYLSVSEGVNTKINFAPFYLPNDMSGSGFDGIGSANIETISDIILSTTSNVGAYLFTSDTQFSVTGTNTDAVIFTTAALNIGFESSCRATIVILPGGSLIVTSGDPKNFLTIYNFSRTATITNSVMSQIVSVFSSFGLPGGVTMTSYLGSQTTNITKQSADFTGLPKPASYIVPEGTVEKFYPDETTNVIYGVGSPDTVGSAIVTNFSIGSMNTISDHISALKYQICYQYKLNYDNDKNLDKINSGDSTEIGTLLLKFKKLNDDRLIPVYVAFALGTTSITLPNIGFSTQSAGFDFYTHQPMIQTRKDGNFYKISDGGNYYKLKADGEIGIGTFICPDGVKTYINKAASFDFFATSAPIGDTVGLGGGYPNQNFIVTKNEIFTLDNSNAPSTLFLGGMKKSCYRYAPLNGYVSDVTSNGKYNRSIPENSISDLYCDYEVVNGVLYIHNRYPSKSRAITLEVTVKGSSDLAEYCNTAENFSVNTDRVTFAGSDFMHFVHNSPTVQDVMIPVPTIAPNPPVNLGDFVTGGSGDFEYVYISSDQKYKYKIGTGGYTDPLVAVTDIVSGNSRTVTFKVCVVFQGIDAVAGGSYGINTPQTNLANGRSVFYPGTAHIPKLWMSGYPITSEFQYLDPRLYDVLKGSGNDDASNQIGSFFTDNTTLKLYSKETAKVSSMELGSFITDRFTSNLPSVIITGKSLEKFYIRNGNAYLSETGGNQLVVEIMDPIHGGTLKPQTGDWSPTTVYFIDDVEYTSFEIIVDAIIKKSDVAILEETLSKFFSGADVKVKIGANGTEITIGGLKVANVSLKYSTGSGNAVGELHFLGAE